MAGTPSRAEPADPHAVDSGDDGDGDTSGVAPNSRFRGLAVLLTSIADTTAAGAALGSAFSVATAGTPEPASNGKTAEGASPQSSFPPALSPPWAFRQQLQPPPPPPPRAQSSRQRSGNQERPRLCGLLPLLPLIALASMTAALPAAAAVLPYSTARRMLQAEPAPPPPAAPAAAQSPESPEQPPPQEPPRQPQRPSPPPPPASIGVAGTSREFFKLLYGSPKITEIRLVRDITLTAADATAADAGGLGPADAAADASNLIIGLGGPPLTRNLTVVGYSRGTHTRLDFNFLAAVLRLTEGVRLTFRKVELYKALNQVGQVLDFVGESTGGVVVLEDCVQRRAVCLPYSLWVAQITSLPNATELRSQRRHEVYLGNGTAFCWTTSSLQPVCKQPFMEMRSMAVYVAPRDGLVTDTGGYDVMYSGGHIVCDNPVEAACLQASTSEQCFTRELVRHFGDVAAPPPPGASDATGQAARDNEEGASQLVVGLAAGLAGGGGALALLSLLVCVLFLVSRRRKRAAAAAAAAAAGANPGKDGGGGATTTAGATSAVTGLDDDDAEAAVRQQREGMEATATLTATKRKDAAEDKDRLGRGGGGDGGGGGGGGDGVATTSDTSSTGGGISTASGKVAHSPPSAAAADVGNNAAALAAAVAAAAASGPTRHDPLDVESIRRSLMTAAQRHPEAPLQVQMLQLLGEGSFGKVYKAIWQGNVVALKALVLSGNLTQDQRRRQMAVMEAAISSSMSHPNIVQTYTYTFRPIRDTATPEGTAMASSSSTGGGSHEINPDAAGASGSGPRTTRVYGHELLLVLEYCDRGSLRQALDAGLFHRHGSAGGGGSAAAAAAATATAAGGSGGFMGPLAAGVGEPPPQPPLDPYGANGEAPDATWLTPAAEFSTLTGPPPPPPHSHSQWNAGGGGAGGGPQHPGQAAFPVRHQQRGDDQLSYNYGLMLQVACDVASALLHLHNHNVVHGDVKASNVLLKTAAPDDRRYLVPEGSHDATTLTGNPGGGGGGGGGGGARPSGSEMTAPSAGPLPLLSAGSTVATVATVAQSAGLVAKVADFGLSTVLGFEGDLERTHITALTAQGSLTHMAPELMLHGHISKRVDVYAFGIVLYELFTGDRAHRGVPRALLPHQVAMGGLRPVLPAHTPPDYRALTESCWAAEPAKRPTFEAILASLERMRDTHASAAAQAALAASRAASFSTTATSRSSAAAAAAAPPRLSVFPWSTAVRPDGWVQVPALESSTCDSALFEELVGSPREMESGDGGGDGGGGRFGSVVARITEEEEEDVPSMASGPCLAVAGGGGGGGSGDERSGGGGGRCCGARL